MGDLEKRLNHARRCFLSGKLNQCRSILEALPLVDVENSSIFQWVKENNLLLCKPSQENATCSSEIGSDATNVSDLSANGLKLILQQLRGLPASRKLSALELALTYNEAMFAYLQGANGEGYIADVKKTTNLLEKNYMACLQRYISTVESGMESGKLTVEEQLNKIANSDVEPDTALCITLLGCVLCVYYLMDGASGKALQLLNILVKLETNEQEMKNGFKLLMKLPSQNREIRLQKHEKACFKASSVVNLLRAYCMYEDNEFASCLDVLQSTEGLPTHILPLWVYMRGYCLYQEDSFSEAAQYVDDLVMSSSGHYDAQMKAKCHNLIGWCLAKQSRLNSAVQQFREALQEDFSYLEPLYNLSLVYRQQRLYDAELESLNLLVTALENKESEESSDVASRLTVGLTQGHTCGMSLISVLYALAKRCLELQRYSVASEKYLDLLAILDESIVLSQMSAKPTPNGLILIPSAEVIYLEAGLALYKSEQCEEALLICDQIISKTTPPRISMVTSDRDDLKSTRLLLSNDRPHKSQDNSIQSSNKILNVGSTKTEDALNFADLSSRTVTTSRKRQRDDDDLLEGQRSVDIKETVTSVKKCDQSKSKHLHMYCSTLLLKSQCCRALHQFLNVEALLDEVLDYLKNVAVIKSETITANPEDGGLGLITKEFGPKLKKRKLDEEETSIHNDKPNLTSHEPIRSSLLELKAQACNDKALILIGQAKLQDAMKYLLRSLQCQPDNPEALYNYILLLLKMGRKQDAAESVNKYRKMEADSDKLKTLENALR